MAKYLAVTFSPAMLTPGASAVVEEAALADVQAASSELVSAVGHEVTAAILSALLGQEVAFNRVNLTLRPGDEVYCIIPRFRAEVAREFTREEVEAAGFRCFRIRVS